MPKKVTASTSANISQVAITSSSNAVAWDARAAAKRISRYYRKYDFLSTSNAVEGAIISVEIAQGSTPRTIAWNTVFEFAAQLHPPLQQQPTKQTY